jgi:hypothetical protein
MSNGEGPPPIFEGYYFSFWKIRMEAYPEAIDVGVLEPPPKGFLKSRIPLTPLVTRRNTTGGMQRPKIHSTRVLVRISSIMCVMQKTLIKLWENLCALHEGTKSEREKHYHIALKKINSFEMLPKESSNDMYTRLNVHVEDLNALGLTL